MDPRLPKIIQDVCKCLDGSLSSDVRLRDIQGWDSLAHMELIAAVEAFYKLQFTGDEIASMHTVGDIWKFIEDRHNAVQA